MMVLWFDGVIVYKYYYQLMLSTWTLEPEHPNTQDPNTLTH